jgi:hypothetical protein
MKRLIKLSSVAVLAVLTSTAVKADPVAVWTFESSSFYLNVTNTGQTPLSPPYSPEVGSGSATAFHLGPNSVWSAPVGNGSTRSFSANTWTNIGDYFQFQTSTLGLSDVSVSFDMTRSSTGPSTFALSYSTDGSSFTVAGSPFAVIVNGTGFPSWNSTTGTNAYSFSFDLSSVIALDNAPAVYFRLANTVSASGTGGTARVDNFTVSAIPEPSAMVLSVLGGFALLWTRTRRLRW